MNPTKNHGSKVLDGDLVWFFNDARGDLGLRAASLEPTVRGDMSEGITDRQIAHARRYRVLDTALQTLPARERAVLELAHTTVAPARQPGLAALGEFALVLAGDGRRPGLLDAAWLAGALYWLRTTGKAQRESRDLARAFIAAATAWARGEVVRALGTYQAARGAYKATQERARDERRHRRLEELGLDGGR